jgi:hypothetical protein
VTGFCENVSVRLDGRHTLRYRPNTDGTFLLYSVSENGVDDGGNPSLDSHDHRDADFYFYCQNPYGLDWVWPQAADNENLQSEKHQELALLYSRTLRNPCPVVTGQKRFAIPQKTNRRNPNNMGFWE